MDQNQERTGRRGASCSSKVRNRKRRMNFVLLVIFVAVAALLIILSPKAPLGRTVYTTGTESGWVDTEGGMVYYQPVAR